MVIPTDAAMARRLRALRQLALLLVSIALTHEVVYWLRGGLAGLLPEDPAHRYWPLMIVLAAIAAALLTVSSMRRLARAAVGLVPVSFASNAGATGYRGEWSAIYRRLLPLVAALYLVLENVEHAFAHGHVEGLGIYLAPGHELTFPVLALVAALITSLGAAVRWHARALAVRHAARRRADARRRPRGPSLPAWDDGAAFARQLLLLARRDLGRAPPLAA